MTMGCGMQRSNSCQCIRKMTTSIANINGANIKRLHIEQFGSNESQSVLTQPLIPDAESSMYNVTIEDLYISSDIPIFPRDTKVFKIIRTQMEVEDQFGNIQIIGTDDMDGIADLEPIQPHRVCTVGPVYNFLDFAHQIQEFLSRFNEKERITHPHVGCNLDGSLVPQKIMSFVASRAFWLERIIVVEDTFGAIFDVFGDVGYYNIFLRHHPNTGARITDTVIRNVDPYGIVFTAVILNDTINAGDAFSVPCESRMDLFENRSRIRIDSVLPLPHEVFCVGAKAGETTRVSNRYTFMEFDFPRETLFTKLRIDNGSVSDDVVLRQELHTGVFRLLKPQPHSGLKTMLPGQTQDHRYEIRIVRKRLQADNSVKLVSEPWNMDPGDYFRMTLLFTKQV